MDAELTIIKLYFSNKPLTVFDVGANNFSFGCTVVKQHLNAVVYGFEADIVNFQNNEQAYKDSKVLHFNNMAISDVNGVSVFYPSLDWLRDNNSKPHRESGSLCLPVVGEDSRFQTSYKGLGFDMSGVEVITRRIDSFCESNSITHIDYMHIDVQGAEDKVIRGLGNIRPSFIFAETCVFGDKVYLTTTTKTDFNDLMKLKGYHLLHSDQMDTLYVHEKFDFKSVSIPH